MDRLPAMLDLLDRRDPMVALRELCGLAVDHVRVGGSAVTVVLAGEPLGVLASAGRAVADLERRRTGLPGPAADAHDSGATIAIADLDVPLPAWLSYGDDARRAGVRSVVALPLLVGRAKYGALVLGADRPGALDGTQRADATVLAGVAAHLVLAVEAGSYADEPFPELLDLTDQRAVVHQAAGMIAVQLDVDIESAHLALRVRAWRLDRTTYLVAREVVARRIRFTDDA